MAHPDLDFVFVGPAKTGTSWIYEFLLTHPDIALPVKVKETYFFDAHFERGLDHYFSLFSSLDRRLSGEVAPTYFPSPVAPENIYSVNPYCQIIITLREPVGRLLSQYRGMVQRNRVRPDMSFDEVVAQTNFLKTEDNYTENTARWIEQFGRDNVHFRYFEDLKADSETFARDLCELLGVNYHGLPEALSGKRVNASQQPVNYALAGLIYKTKHQLREMGFYGLVNFVKNSGVKKFLYKEEDVQLELGEREKQIIYDYLADDLKTFEVRFGLDLRHWHEAWARMGLKTKSDAAV